MSPHELYTVIKSSQTDLPNEPFLHRYRYPQTAIVLFVLSTAAAIVVVKYEVEQRAFSVGRFTVSVVVREDELLNVCAVAAP